jgi:hypothetical protein
MKKLIGPGVVGLICGMVLIGCVAVVKDQPPITKSPTTGQQLTDLKHAKDVGAITDEEYEAQKAKLLGKQ